MKYILIVIILLFPISSSQRALEFYTLEEVTILIEEQYSHSNYYYCYRPFQFLCNIRTQFENQANSEPDLIIPYTSVADLEKLHQYFLPYIEEVTKFNFRKYGNHRWTDSEMQERILQNHEFETWEDYVQNTYETFYTRYLTEALNDYSAGFIQIQDDYIEGWSAIKMDYLNNSLHYPLGKKDVVTQQEADLLLGATATLISVKDSLYDSSDLYMNYSSIEELPDLFFWVYGDKAIGLTKEQHFKIVDGSGEPLDLLNTGVETRIVETTIRDIETFEIQVLFDLVPLDD